MQSLPKRLMPAVSSALLAATLSGCCVFQEAYYCITESNTSNNSSVRKEVIKLSQPSTSSYTVTPSYQPPAREDGQNKVPSYLGNPLD